MLSSTHAPRARQPRSETPANSRARRLQARAQARLTGAARPAPQPLSVRQYRLQCPSGCASVPVEGLAEAARLVRDHPAVCPNPGPALQPVHGSAFRPLVYAEPVI